MLTQDQVPDPDSGGLHPAEVELLVFASTPNRAVRTDLDFDILRFRQRRQQTLRIAEERGFGQHELMGDSRHVGCLAGYSEMAQLLVGGLQGRLNGRSEERR